ncbi:hypothetical protein O181_105719 [Austropuccinia psidii MF-1]|uniref:Uncharacterized protein n=1 Tax=Austropuccinia psidii MF-1 TaxID=1389203 RepID=A0A9Q3JQP5_9BASI|nr:hypothetical protein [Austropuccinia psidii MF-1]
MPETIPHYLLFRRQYQAQQRELQRNIKKHRLRLNPNSSGSLLDCPAAFTFLAEYIISSARFQHIRNHTPQKKPTNPAPPINN